MYISNMCVCGFTYEDTLHQEGPPAHLGVELCLHTPLDPQHLSERVLVAVGNLKLLPALPVGLVHLMG